MKTCSFLLPLFLILTIHTKANTVIKDIVLKECPQKPNCVSTQTEQTDKKMVAIPFNSDPGQIKKLLIDVISKEPRTKLIKNNNSYLHFTFKSRFFGFTDDVEFSIDNSKKLIHFRSASRTGYSDLGVNRKRMTLLSEKIKKGLLTSQATEASGSNPMKDAGPSSN